MDAALLRKVAGALALGFGIYCLAVVGSNAATGTPSMSIVPFLLWLIYGIMYAIFGMATLLAKPGSAFSFIFFGLVISSIWWHGGLPLYAVPMLVMPWLILGLTAAALLVEWRAGSAW
jgi:hypothetical protein